MFDAIANALLRVFAYMVPISWTVPVPGWLLLIVRVIALTLALSLMLLPVPWCPLNV